MTPISQLLTDRQMEGRAQSQRKTLTETIKEGATTGGQPAGFNWTDMIHVTDPRDASERLKAYWTSVGVTAALLCSIAFSGLYTGPFEDKFEDKSSSIVTELYVISMGACFLSTLAALMLCTILTSRMNALPRDEDVKWFIIEFRDYHLLPTRFFQIGCFFMVIGVLFGVQALYSTGMASLLLWVIGLSLLVATYLGYMHLKQCTNLRLSSAIGNIAELRALFKLIDEDGGGSIDVDELKCALETDPSLCESLGITQKYAEKVFEKVDDGGDGEISWEEFKVFFGCCSSGSCSQ